MPKSSKKQETPGFDKPRFRVNSKNWEITVLDKAFYISTISEPHFPIVRFVFGGCDKHFVNTAIYPDEKVWVFELMPQKAFVEKFGSMNIAPEFAKELLESYIDYVETSVVFPDALKHLQREAADVVSQ